MSKKGKNNSHPVVLDTRREHCLDEGLRILARIIARNLMMKRPGDEGNETDIQAEDVQEMGG